MEDRIAAVSTMSKYFETNADELAKRVTEAVGKPITESRSEIRATCDLIRSMCNDAATELPTQVIVANDFVEKFIVKEPVGVAFVTKIILIIRASLVGTTRYLVLQH